MGRPEESGQECEGQWRYEGPSPSQGEGVALEERIRKEPVVYETTGSTFMVTNRLPARLGKHAAASQFPKGGNGTIAVCGSHSDTNRGSRFGQLHQARRSIRHGTRGADGSGHGCNRSYGLRQIERFLKASIRQVFCCGLWCFVFVMSNAEKYTQTYPGQGRSSVCIYSFFERGPS